jgi:hypothetical protein
VLRTSTVSSTAIAATPATPVRAQRYRDMALTVPGGR